MDSDLKKIPSPAKSPFFGHTLELLKDPIGYQLKIAKDYPGIAEFSILGKRAYLISDREMTNMVLRSKNRSFNKGPYYERLALVAGQGLITSESDDHWKRQRRLAQPAFHKDKIKGFVDLFIDEADKLCRELEKMDDGKPHAISLMFSKLTLRIIAKAIFSLELSSGAEKASNVVKQLLGFLNKRSYSVLRFPMNWPLPSHKSFYRQLKYLDDVIYGIIEARLEGKNKGDDLLEMFMNAVDEETGEKMNKKDLRDEMITMFVAGFETSSVSLMWTAYLLSQNPKVEEKLLDEINTVVQDGSLKYEDFPKLKYAQQVVKESLRLYSPVFTIPRFTNSEIELKGYSLKNESITLLSIGGIHRSEEYWEKPNEFIPERFSKENEDKLVKDAYLPFGMGQRICIGNNFAIMEIVYSLCTILPKIRFELPEGYIPKAIPTITQSEKNGMPMFIRKR